MNQIYLFFDYDGHDNLADDEKIKEMLSFFDKFIKRIKVVDIEKGLRI